MCGLLTYSLACLKKSCFKSCIRETLNLLMFANDNRGTKHWNIKLNKYVRRQFFCNWSTQVTWLVGHVKATVESQRVTVEKLSCKVGVKGAHTLLFVSVGLPRDFPQANPWLQNLRGCAPSVLQLWVWTPKILREPSHCPAAQCRHLTNSSEGTVFSTLPQGFSTVVHTFKIMRFFASSLDLSISKLALSSSRRLIRWVMQKIGLTIKPVHWRMKPVLTLPLITVCGIARSQW